MPDDLRGQFTLVVQGGHHMKRARPERPNRPGNIVQIQIGDRRGHRLTLFVDDRVVNQRYMQIDPG
jgi:hypothetical protein